MEKEALITIICNHRDYFKNMGGWVPIGLWSKGEGLWVNWCVDLESFWEFIRIASNSLNSRNKQSDC